MRTVYATTLEIGSDEDVLASLGHVGNWIQDWYKRQRLSVDVSGNLAANDLELVPAEHHRLTISHHETSGGDRLTDLRWEYPDLYDKTLAWVTRISLLRSSIALTFSIDLAVTGVGPMVLPATFRLGSPRVVRDVARLSSVSLAGHPYHLAPELIGAGEVEVLAGELLDVGRPFPVVVVSRTLENDRPLVDAVDLAEQLAGVAKVYELVDKWASFRLTEEVGKPLSCFAGAVRLYWPGLKLSSEPFAHPNLMPWHLENPQTAATSLQRLRSMVLEASAFRQGQPASIVNARLLAQREAREKLRGENTRGVDELLDDQIALEAKLKNAEDHLAELTTEVEILRANSLALTSQASWTAADAIPAEPTEAAAAPAEVAPASIEAAVHRAQTSSKNLLFLPSARESAASSPFRHAERVLEALLAIDEVAAAWARSVATGASVGSLRDQFKQKGFEYADDVSATSKGKWGDQYSANHQGRVIDISPHITIGAKQADSCVSIHWAWDRDERKAIVAHVGRHKTNTRT